MTLSSSPFLADTTRRAIFWTLSAVFLTLAVVEHGGEYSPLALIWLSLSIASAIIGTYAPRLPLNLDLNFVLSAACVLFGALTFQSFLQSSLPASTLVRAASLAGFVALSALLAFALSFFVKRGLGKILFPLFLMMQLFIGIFTIQSAHDFEQTSPKFRLQVRHDVQIFNREAARLLVAGQNPYSVRMPNVMGQDMPFYPPNTTAKDGKLPFGYVYMPAGLFFILPGYLLGDFRFAHVFALVGAAWFLGYARPSKTAQLSATLFLLFPPTSRVLILSWTEPIALFFLAATLFCAFRAPKWLFLSLGCLICAKQYTVFLLPLLPLLVPERAKWQPLMLRSLAVALVLTLPMALWDVDGFFRSAVQMQFKQPFRVDSLSYLVTFLNLTGRQLSPILGFLALIGGLFYGGRAPKNASHWTAAGAVAYLGFFALNKQAFANYYFWVFGLLIAAVAVALPRDNSHEKAH
ncbi:hypothetical protein B1R32_11937 [Abditibacterium utsteinense]|uniref:Dolichyl-phosphate-mannose-protein mannosyltransferase n=1 Tax=Abditibacterium utsteinense TaxID=1960156 RepID=A0A2S8SQ22_9BACT|nr:hypothetical protein [Abditibacterium utsteinense]PQV62897.1 hypothetical protein B1R32_11937 [Abditibacterium utsteinense]